MPNYKRVIVFKPSKIMSSFDFVHLKPSSEDTIVSLSVPIIYRGKLSLPELTSGRTLDYNALDPEDSGLFCQILFGPKVDFTCACGQIRTDNQIRYDKLKHYTCPKCEVQYIDSTVRRHRIGLIRFGCPIPHIWYILGPGCLVAQAACVSKDLVKDLVYTDKQRDYLALEKLLEDVSGPALRHKVESLRVRYPFLDKTRSERFNLGKQLRTLENMYVRHIQPSSLVIRSLPVLPPGLRPMTQLGTTKVLVSADLNTIYRRIVYRTSRFLFYRRNRYPLRLILREYILIAEAVDTLLDNGRAPKPYRGDDGLPLKSLSDNFGGKEGRFRQDLMGKRVNYSARAVLASGPQYDLTECGLPRDVAIIFFANYILRALILNKKAENLGDAEMMLYNRPNLVDQFLREMMRDHPILINRAPTLHAYGMQGFYPLLIAGHSVELPSLTCHGMAADFDGDQVGIHFPIGLEAQSEAFEILGGERFSKSFRGILDPMTPMTQDMIVGSVFLSNNTPLTRYNSPPYAHLSPYFSHIEDLIFAIRANQLHPQDTIWFLVNGPVIDQHKPFFTHTYEVGRTTLLKFSCHSRIKENLKDGTAIQYIKTTAGCALLNWLTQ